MKSTKEVFIKILSIIKDKTGFIRPTLFVLVLLFGLYFDSNAQGYDVSKNDKSFYNFVETFQSLTQDSLSIDALIKEDSIFKIPERYFYYQTFLDSTFWIKIPIKNNSPKKTKAYFIVENAYLQDGDFWIVRSDKIPNQGHHHNYQYINQTPKLSNYPTWSFDLNSNEFAYIYARIIDSERRTSLELQLLDESGFNNYKTLEIVYQIVYVAFLLALIVVIIIFCVGNKEPSTLFYAAYLLFLIIDYTAINGFGQTYIWNDSLFLINNIRSLSHAFMLFFSTLFFTYFYKRIDPPRWVMTYFKIIPACFIPFFFLYFLKLFSDPFPKLYLLLWQFIMLATVSLVLVHFYLFIKKKIPGYLSFAFLLPLLGVQFRNYFVPHHLMSEWIVNLSNNAYFYSVIIELLLIAYYVMTSAHRKNVKLNEEFIKNEKLEKKIEDMSEQHSSIQIENIVLRSKALINLKELMYIKSDGHYLEFYLKNKSKPEIDRNTFKHLEDTLPRSIFIRIHKSYLVNINYIKMINSTQLMLENGTWLNISRTYKSRLKQVVDLGK